MVWLDFIWEDCRAAILARGYHSPDPAEQSRLPASFARLLNWAEDYYVRSDARSRFGHAALHEAFPGAKHRFVSRAAVDSFLGSVASAARTSARESLSLEPAQLADAAAIARIHIDTWRSSYREILPVAHLAALSVERRTAGWERVIREKLSEIRVARIDGKVVGWISFGSCRDANEEHEAEIQAIYVDADRQGRGIGAALLAHAEEDLAERLPRAARISLWVLERNIPARNFYAARGYHCGSAKKEERIGGETFVELRYEKSFAATKT